MKVFSKFISLISLMFISSYGFALQEPDEVKPEIDLDRSMIVNIEVIEVKGSRSLSFYRRALSRAEKSLYNEYNKLTDNDELKVICRTEQITTGSRKKKQKCRPRYEKTLQAKETQFAISRMGATLVNNRSSDVTSLSPTGGQTSGTLGVGISETVGALLHVEGIVNNQNRAGNSQLERKRLEHYDDMLKMLKQNPELRQKFLEYVIAKQKYQLSREQSYED